MKRLLLSLIALTPLCLFGFIPLTEDYTKASHIAQAYNRPLLLVFTGSDWCSWSKKLLADLIRDQSFEKAIGSHFIVVQLDYPELNRKSCSALKVNQDLKDRYDVQSFPTIVMTDPLGREITRLGYMANDPKDFATHLKDLFVSYTQLHYEVDHMDFSQASLEAVQELYDRARELHCPHYMSKLLEEGVVLDKGVYFPLEKYAQLVSTGDADTEVAEKLKRTIIERDPKNEEGARLRLALLDFQAHENEPDRAIEPLGSYIADFGAADKENLWRLHLIISQYFSQNGDEALAKEHEEKSREEAPKARLIQFEKALDATD